mmetsp:Transcript_121269/g.387514  ORF Transcript_121269/g.387514 Transcript_121269/m.387514 type:complete len:208 (+) Transcript_121269:794-1417(+)
MSHRISPPAMDKVPSRSSSASPASTAGHSEPLSVAGGPSLLALPPSPPVGASAPATVEPPSASTEWGCPVPSAATPRSASHPLPRACTAAACRLQPPSSPMYSCWPVRLVQLEWSAMLPPAALLPSPSPPVPPPMPLPPPSPRCSGAPAPRRRGGGEEGAETAERNGEGRGEAEAIELCASDVSIALRRSPAAANRSRRRCALDSPE